MTMKTVVKLPILALASALFLTGCSNDPERGTILTAFKNALPKIGQGAAPQAVKPADIQQVLAGTDAPLSQITQKDLDGISVLIVPIEQNGAYRTYATASKQTLTFRQGIVTATRGLGNDLMSSDVSDTLALLRSRQGGTTTRTMRYLDGANEVFTFDFACTVTVEGSQSLSQGAVRANVTKMTESCSAPSRNFTNTYLVDASGTVLSSTQWISPVQGAFDIKVLRR